MRTIVELPNGTRIVFTDKAHPRVVQMVNDSLKKLNQEYVR